MQKVNVLGTLDHKWDVSINSLTSELREAFGRGGIKGVRATEDEDTKKKRPYKHRRTDAYRDSQ